MDVIFCTAQMTSTSSYKTFGFGYMITSMRHSQQQLQNSLEYQGTLRRPMSIQGYHISKNCAWSKHSSYFQWHNLHSFQQEAVQIAKEGKGYLSFPTLRLQMSHRATICICRRFQSFCIHTHPGNISKHYSTLR